MSLSWLAHGLAASGPSDDARVLLTELDTGPQQRQVSPYHVAIVHTGLGDHDAAFTALELTCEAKGHRPSGRSALSSAACRPALLPSPRVDRSNIHRPGRPVYQGAARRPYQRPELEGR